MKEVYFPKPSMSYAYKMGFDCGVNGPNQKNCHFSLFSSPQGTREWEEGKQDAEEGLQRKEG